MKVSDARRRSRLLSVLVLVVVLAGSVIGCSSAVSRTNNQQESSETATPQPPDAAAVGIAIEADVPAVVEGDGAPFTVTASETPSGAPVAVAYTVSGTARAGSDYTAPSGTVTLAAGASQARFTIVTRADEEPEELETIVVQLEHAATTTGESAAVDNTPATVTLVEPPSTTHGSGVGNGTVTQEDEIPVLAIQDAAAAENAGSMSFQVLLARAKEQVVSVSYETKDATASSSSGSDYADTAGVLTFVPGEPLEQSIIVPIAADGEDEPDEVFSVSLHSPMNAALGDAEAIGTIVDNRNAERQPGVDLPTLTIANSRASEGDGPMRFTVTLNRMSDREVTVSYETSGFSAKPATDYQHTSGRLTFGANDPHLTRTIDVPIVQDDRIDDLVELFFVILSAPVNAVLSVASASGTIEDDDDAEGDTRETAMTVTPRTVIAGRIEGSADVDVFKVAVMSDRELLVATDHGKAGPFVQSSVVRIETTGYTSSNEDHFDSYHVAANTDYAYVFVTAPRAHHYDLFLWLIGPDKSGFQIELEYLDQRLSMDQKTAIMSAADKWEDVVTGDLPRLPIINSGWTCQRSGDPPGGSTAFGGLIDDLKVEIAVRHIDGPGNSHSLSGPCVTRSDGLPALGRVILDEDDFGVADTVLPTEYAKHGIGHVLGFGTIAQWRDLVRNSAYFVSPGDAPPDTHFAGRQAVSAFDALPGNTYMGGKVPLDNAVTRTRFRARDAHWRDSVFGPELMSTGIPVQAVPLSTVTVGALEDLGYTVNAAVGATITLPETSVSLLTPQSAALEVHVVDDIRSEPIIAAELPD